MVNTAELMTSSGKRYHEVVLGNTFTNSATKLGWFTERLLERNVQRQEPCNVAQQDDDCDWTAIDAPWPRGWRGGDVIGFALDSEAGTMRFSLNGDWPGGAVKHFFAAGEELFPALPACGDCRIHVAPSTWHFAPPSSDYEPWGGGGVPTWPTTHQAFAAEGTTLFFDWDDTVLPSAWLHDHGLSLDDRSVVAPWQREQLRELSKLATETIRVAKELGTVVFVTNAERGWIEQSCRKFMPDFLPALDGVKLLSARTTYETPELTCPLEWKVRAFEDEIERLFDTVDPDVRKNVISLGDSEYEREALWHTTSSLPNTRAKALKFMERPTVSQLCAEHVIVADCLRSTVQTDCDLDVQVGAS
jgi:hypothetical protein